ncbi:phage regulatory CII family protein [Afifella sp. IM 167]|uniref:phage regulatory CII family protein n=1 Tax=Afifella sp. IM 167 TaxID=2033586 RepID=UPI001CCCF166|nr:phage regulatory CII family protein [Afifella sp. IM 167]MBZ8133261.1 hypothetical protein [Afifella sp. IM 167]
MSRVDHPARPSSTADRALLKAASQRAVHEAGGPEKMQYATRIGQSGLSRAGSMLADDIDRFLALDVALDVDRACGKPIVATTLAGLLGYELRPRGVSAGGSDLTGHLITINRETSEATGALLEALRDGEITESERRRCLKEIDDAAHALNLAAAALRGGAGG